MATELTGRFIDLHIVQAVPYANLNRDDTNSIKTVQYGGVSRTRVSSQAWKRALRLEIERALGEQALRTRRIAERLAHRLRTERAWPAELAARAGIYTVVSSSIGAEAPKPGRKSDPDQDENDTPWGTKAMVYIPDTAIGELADLADLHRNLGGDQQAARRLAEAFLAATILSLPQAKKNSTAPHTFPDLIAVSVRGDRPYSYAAAFEKPVTPGPDGGFTPASIDAMDTYVGALTKLLGNRIPPYSGYAGTSAKDLEHLGTRTDSFDELITAALDAAMAARATS